MQISVNHAKRMWEFRRGNGEGLLFFGFDSPYCFNKN